MRVTKQKQRRNRAVIALLLPAILLMWIVGWAFYWIGHQKEGRPLAKPVPKRNSVTLTVATALEEEPIVSS